MGIVMDGNVNRIKEQAENSINRRGKNDDIVLYFAFNETKNNSIKFNVDLVKKYLSEINRLYPNNNYKFHFSYSYKNNYVLDTNDCKELEEVDEYLRKTINNELYIYDENYNLGGFGFRRTLSANRKLDDIAEDIKNASYNGESLSNFEKFMLVYEYVTNYAYNESDDMDPLESRKWVSVMEGDKIVCAGYASLIRTLCEKVFTNNEVKAFQQSVMICDKVTDYNYFSHEVNTIIIKDEKYGLDGVFYIDSCWDSSSFTTKSKAQAFCCLPLQDVLHYKKCDFSYKKGLIHFYLLQNDRYIDITFNKDKSNQFSFLEDVGIEIDLETFFNHHLSDEEEVQREYLLNHVEGLIKYDKWKFNTDEQKEVSTYKTNRCEYFINECRDLIEEYKNVKFPLSISEELMNKYKLRKNGWNLFSGEVSDEEIVNSIRKICKVFSKEEVQQYLKDNNECTCDIEKYINSNVSEFSHREKVAEISKRKKELSKEINLNNLNNIQEYLNDKSSSIVPLEAFITSYKIIGERKGLKGDKLKEYVGKRLIQSIRRTKREFDISKCDGCFANTSVEDIENIFSMNRR